jgi:hypothetical protein
MRPPLENLGRLDTGSAWGCPRRSPCTLDASYDSTTTRDLLDELGCDAVISQKGFLPQAGAR